MPRLWTETIEEHRRAVHDATLDTTAALVREHGLASVTMSQIAAAAGIGRAVAAGVGGSPVAEAMASRAHLPGVAADPREIRGGVFGLDVGFGGQHGVPFLLLLVVRRGARSGLAHLNAPVLSRQTVAVNSNRLHADIMYP